MNLFTYEKLLMHSVYGKYVQYLLYPYYIFGSEFQFQSTSSNCVRVRRLKYMFNITLGQIPIRYEVGSESALQ